MDSRAGRSGDAAVSNEPSGGDLLRLHRRGVFAIRPWAAFPRAFQGPVLLGRDGFGGGDVTWRKKRGLSFQVAGDTVGKALHEPFAVVRGADLHSLQAF